MELGSKAAFSAPSANHLTNAGLVISFATPAGPTTDPRPNSRPKVAPPPPAASSQPSACALCAVPEGLAPILAAFCTLLTTNSRLSNSFPKSAKSDPLKRTSFASFDIVFQAVINLFTEKPDLAMYSAPVSTPNSTPSAMPGVGSPILPRIYPGKTANSSGVKTSLSFIMPAGPSFVPLTMPLKALSMVEPSLFKILSM